MKIKKKYVPRTSCIKDKTGNQLSVKQEVIDRWAEYCEQLYSDNRLHDEKVNDELQEISPPSVLDDRDIMLEEIERAVHDLINSKATGTDGIPAEIIKAGGKPLINIFHIIFQQIWTDTAVLKVNTDSHTTERQLEEIVFNKINKGPSRPLTRQ